MRKKSLSYYMSLEYVAEIIPIPKEEGGGFKACIPQLGRHAFIGDGDSREEALKDLENTKREYFIEFIKKGIEIPDPEKQEREFRGEVLLRMPKAFHRELYFAARKNEVSLNQYMVFLLTKNLQISQLSGLFVQCFQKIWERGWDTSTGFQQKEKTLPWAENEERLIGA
jgi:antitoxin HicB